MLLTVPVGSDHVHEYPGRFQHSSWRLWKCCGKLFRICAFVQKLWAPCFHSSISFTPNLLRCHYKQVSLTFPHPRAGCCAQGQATLSLGCDQDISGQLSLASSVWQQSELYLEGVSKTPCLSTSKQGSATSDDKSTPEKVGREVKTRVRVNSRFEKNNKKVKQKFDTDFYVHFY